VEGKFRYERLVKRASMTSYVRKKDEGKRGNKHCTNMNNIATLRRDSIGQKTPPLQGVKLISCWSKDTDG